MIKHTLFSILSILLSLMLTTSISVIAQEKEVVKQRAEKELQKATPEQIKAKIKELGLTEKEAETRANDLGIDLQQYLGIQSGQPEPQTSGEPQQPESQIQSIKPQPITPAVIPQTKFTVPGFEGRTGTAGLQPFGYNIFQYPTSTFEPVLNLPTPPGYILGPGDEVLLTMWGETQLFTQLAVNREGNIIIPNAGPVVAQGMTVEALKTRLLRRLTSFYSGLKNGAPNANTWLDVSVGKLRTIQIFILGEVNKPGGYSVSSMSTSFLALYVAGGPSINGSLRSIEVLRNNKVISTIDFYDYALRGDKSKDIRLQDGDIIFIKPVGKRVALVGNVIRSAIYELKSEETLAELLSMAGGLLVNAYYDRAHVERIIPFAERKFYTKNILDLDLKFSSVEELLQSDFKLENGDLVSVLRINEFLQNRVTISGNVKKPGVFALRNGMKVQDLINEADSLLSDTFGERANIIRVLPNLRKQVIPFNLDLAMQKDSINNIELEPEDEVIIYKENYFFPEHPVSIAGAVRKPGKYIRTEEMTVANLVVIAGGLTESASKQDWELSRIDTNRIGTYSIIRKFNVNDNYWDDQSGDPLFLQDFDHVMVPSNPKFNLQRFVEVQGYVLYPGTYTIQQEGERLTEIIRRAGGLRPGAYLEGSTLTRKWNNAGLVPIDFIKALADTESLENIVLLDGDVINIAFKQEVVLVRGEVFVPAAVVYKKGASLKYYLNQAGGLKEEADEGRIVVMLPNGKKWEEGWFILPNPEILGGSTIYVSKKIEKEDKTLPIMRDWATIMVSIATMMIAIVQVTK